MYSARQPPNTMTVNWCVQSLWVREDGSIEIAVIWAVNVMAIGDTGRPPLQMNPDVGNTNMYLVDNLGRRYDHTATGGAAALGGTLPWGQETTLTGAFVFPPAQPGASTFAFHDDDQGVVINNLNFSRRAPSP